MSSGLPNAHQDAPADLRSPLRADHKAHFHSQMPVRRVTSTYSCSVYSVTLHQRLFQNYGYLERSRLGRIEDFGAGCSDLDSQLSLKGFTQAHLPEIKVHAYFAPVTPPPSVHGGGQRLCRCCIIL
uniref:Uncharacterized protein n=1 Tax=Knipowitschia caucasica TaxID=637954 RepID=A0AAV2KAI4_KNICA